MATTSVYEPLRLPDTIRILHLEPAKAKDAPLSGRFSVTDLKNPARYNALSYTWNGETPSVPLLVDGQTVLVTPNCASALRRLRKSSKVRVFWIDSVCINQADVQERNAQVTMMGEIYKKSAWVLAWLGERTEASQKGWRRLNLQMQFRDYLRPVSMIFSFASLIPIVPTNIKASFGVYAHDLYYAGSDIDKLKEGLCQSPYWTRVWTIQEFTARRQCRIYFGNARGIPSSTFIKFIADSHLHFGTLHGACSPYHRRALGEDGIWPSIFLENLCSSEPRDYVYALRPVLPSLLQSVEVKYEAPLSQVFAEATKGYVLHRQSLDILSYATIASATPGLPSWAVDWSSQTGPIHMPKQHVNNTHRKHRTPCVEFSTDSLIMKVKGLKILELSDYLGDVFPPMEAPTIMFTTEPPTGPLSLETRHGIVFRDFLRHIYQTQDQNKAADFGNNMLSKLLYLTALNIRPFANSRANSKATTRIAEDWFRILITGGASKEVDLRDAAAVRDHLEQEVRWGIYDKFMSRTSDLRSFIQACEQKRLFIAEGKLGLCWPDIRIGDQIVRVRDKDMYESLIVVRPLGEQFVLAGHAVLAEETLDEWNESGVQEFELI